MEELLHKAIANGDDESVRELIENGASMDQLMGLRGTALCAAISDHKIDIACYLIEAGCDVNGEDYDREPPLMLAMRKECFIIVKKLVDHPKCNVNKPDPLFKVSPLCFAAKSGQHEVVNWLVNAKCDLDSKDGNGNNALHLAIANSHYDIVENLARSGCDINSENNEGFAPIHTLARIGDYKNLIRLLSPWIAIDDKLPDSFSKFSMSKDLEAKTSKLLNSVTKFKQETPLLLATRGGHGEMIKILLACGANPNLGDYPDFGIECNDSVLNKNYSTTPLLRASFSYRMKRIDLGVIKWLLDAGSCVDKVGMVDIGQEKLLMTPLLFAATFDVLDLARLLIVQYGANVNLSVGDINPLYQAIFRNSVNVMWYLLNDCDIRFTGVVGDRHKNYFHSALYLPDTHVEKVLVCLANNGCSVNGADSDGKTPLFRAVEKLDIKYINMILKLNADVTLYNLFRETPLHKSVELGAIDITKVLITHGANVNSKNASDMTPLDIALEDMEDDEHKELAILLLQNGAMVTRKASAIMSLDRATPRFIDECSESDSDDSLSDCSSEMIMALETTLEHLITEREGVPISLFILSVITLRNYFRENKLSFNNISFLPLPKSIIDQVVLK